MGLVYQPQSGTASLSETYQKSGLTKGQIKDNGTSLYRQDGVFNLQYPINLDSGEMNNTEFGKQRVVFFINVPGNLKTLKASENSADYRQFATEIPANEYLKLSGASNLAGALSQTSSDAVNKIAGVFRTKRLLACICLYVPNLLTTLYTTIWSEEDMYGLAMLDAGLNIASSVLSSGVKLTKEASLSGQLKTLLEAGGDGLGLVAANVVRQTLSNSDYLSKALRMTGGNSKAEQLFRGVDFRTINYEYDFAPRSEEEASAVLDIIRMFRHHMLPEYADDNQFIYVYPLEFDIKYYNGDAENEYLEKQMTAVLTNCNVNYTPNGQFNTFENGMPTHIRMTLLFKELGTPLKETSPFNELGI